MGPILALSLVFSACAAEPTFVQESVVNPAQPTLAVSARRDDAVVVLSWRLRNTSAAPLWLADLPLTESAAGVQPLPGRAIVRQPPAAGSPLLVTVGYAAPYDQKLRELFPVVRELAAGAETSGEVRIALPLTSFHPQESRQTPIEGSPSRVTLRVGVFDTAPQTSAIVLASGETAQMLATPSVRAQRWVQAEIAWP